MLRMKNTVHVAVGIVVDKTGNVLIALRHPDAHQGGLWEFPGGKCESGESVSTALRRELHEELGIHVLSDSPFCLVRHNYGDKQVLLDVRRVNAFTGVARGQEGQPLRWLSVESLRLAEFPEANRPIIKRLQLPQTIAITGECDSEQDFDSRFASLLSTGLTVVQVRAPDISHDLLRARVLRCLSACRAHNVKMIVNTEPTLFADIEADGLHVSSRSLQYLDTRPVPRDLWFGVSCHDRHQLLRAEALEADYAFLSPVQFTCSHPEQSPLGWEVFAALTAGLTIPVYALGGLGAEHVELARMRGAHGIAAISAFWPKQLFNRAISSTTATIK
jgi:8-oxo-dGTP diphosphatase